MTSQERPSECVRLAEALRELRAAAGLSLAALAAKTPYSKSSWERYLNGKTLPPRQAVEELCVLAGERQDRPLALWGLAESAWSGRAGVGAAGPAGARREEPRDVADAPTPEADGEPGPAERGRWRSTGFLAGTLGGLAAVAAGVLLVVWGFGGSGTDAEGAPTSVNSGPAPGCSGDSCTGKDAEATRCSGAANPPGTLAEHRFGGGTVVKVRRSVECGAVWARIDRGRVGDRVEIVAPGIGTQQTEVRDRFDEEGSLPTPMAAARRDELADVRGCLVRDGERQCFGAGGKTGDAGK
ncbi:helix-turn-helix domain-containing protein [Streptomyces sp. NPDC059037]|uniref:helix-turn-helix domain-containing protein n=1 Tax=Streptomyces sp. NPDC059037 TaxID=3346710 RepID=UPI0036BBF373